MDEAHSLARSIRVRNRQSRLFLSYRGICARANRGGHHLGSVSRPRKAADFVKTLRPMCVQNNSSMVCMC